MSEKFWERFPNDPVVGNARMVLVFLGWAKRFGPGAPFCHHHFHPPTPTSFVYQRGPQLLVLFLPPQYLGAQQLRQRSVDQLLVGAGQTR